MRAKVFLIQAAHGDEWASNIAQVHGTRDEAKKLIEEVERVLIYRANLTDDETAEADFPELIYYPDDQERAWPPVEWEPNQAQRARWLDYVPDHLDVVEVDVVYPGSRNEEDEIRFIADQFNLDGGYEW